MSVAELVTQARSSLPCGIPWVELLRFLVGNFQLRFGYIIVSDQSQAATTIWPTPLPGVRAHRRLHWRRPVASSTHVIWVPLDLCVEEVDCGSLCLQEIVGVVEVLPDLAIIRLASSSSYLF